MKYWESRREVFGPKKYTMRMTLSEGLRDDLVALDTGVYTLLSRRDLSGRQILYMEPRCHTREGYSSESMVSGQQKSFVWYANVAICLTELIVDCVVTRHLVCLRGGCTREY